MLRIKGLEVPPVRVENLEIEPGITALSAPSGSGKSRFFRAIADLVVNRGTVQFGEFQREEIPAPDWRRMVRFVSAEPGWWSLKTRPHFPDYDRCVRLMGRFGLAPALIDSPVAELSSGERQRFGLIRALMDDPEVLLLDEPTAALDETTSLKVEAELSRRAESGGTILLISHSEAQIARLANQVLTIRDGWVGVRP